MLLPLLLACTPPPPETVTVYIDSDDPNLSAIEAFVDHVGDERLRVSVESAAHAAAESDEGIGIVIEPSEACDECYLLRDEDGAYQVEAGGLLGAQYGLAHLLELFGYRFPHPFAARLPVVLPRRLSDDHRDLLVAWSPEQSLRGLHLHTLHPIEGLWGFWEAPPEATDPAAAGQARVEAVIDWVIKNRGNHLQWVGLDDIESDEETHAAWLERTVAANEAAHARGLSTGLGVQLFGSGNLQQAFDLIDTPEDEKGWQDAMDARWALLTEADFDVYDLSFGEFFGEEPETFIAAIELARQRLAEADAEAEMTAVVHVGDDQRVTYEGQELIYYQLVQYAEADITPHVHTVMYYTLFDDAGGAYHHDEFDLHRQMLLEHLQAGERVAYFPESAYWVAFDNPVPLYLPLYVHSRHRDLAEIRARAQEGGFDDLSEHVLFSSGWEWGYWQNDAMTLRMGYTLPDDWGDLYRDWFVADAGEGLQLAQAVIDLAEAQHVALIEQRGAAYLAGRDAAMDVGFGAGIVAAPDRVELEELAALSAEERATFEAEVLAPLATLEEATALARDAVQKLEIARTDPWAREVLDGMRIDLYRVRFVLALYRAVLAEDPTEQLAEADQAWTNAQGVVQYRHAHLHDPLGDMLIDDSVANATIYDYGYLVRAEQLCFWERERIQAARLLEGSTEQVPSCF